MNAAEVDTAKLRELCDGHRAEMPLTDGHESYCCDVCAIDVRTLLDELDRLRAELASVTEFAERRDAEAEMIGSLGSQLAAVTAWNAGLAARLIEAERQRDEARNRPCPSCGHPIHWHDGRCAGDILSCSCWHRFSRRDVPAQPAVSEPGPGAVSIADEIAPRVLQHIAQTARRHPTAFGIVAAPADGDKGAAA